MNTFFFSVSRGARLFGNKRLMPREKSDTVSFEYGGYVEIFEKGDSQQKCVAEQGP